jgi:hypothetical protein
MEPRSGPEMAAEYDDEQLAALLSAIGSDVTKAKQSLEANMRGIDDALEDLFVGGGIYATDKERSMVNQEPVAYQHASNVEFPAIIDVAPSTMDASTPATPESSQKDLCRTCGTKVCNAHFRALGGLKGRCLHCYILVNRLESEGAEKDPDEEESAKEDSIQEEKPLEEEEKSTYLSSNTDKNPQAEIRFVPPAQHDNDHETAYDDVVSDEDHDGMQQSHHGHSRTFLASPPVWLWLETVNDESELLIIPNASRLDRIMETLTNDTSSLSRRTERVASTRGEHRGAQDAQHGYRFGDLTRSAISKGNELTQSVISKGKKKAGRSENDRYKFGDITRGLIVMGLNTVR